MAVKKTTAAKKTPAAAPADDTESARTESLAVDQGTDAPADEQTDALAAGAQSGSVVRLNDPEDEGPDRYALVVGDQLIVDLPGVRGYQLPVYPAS
jgi:hypothetical protein